MTKTILMVGLVAGGFAIAGASPALAWQNAGTYNGPNGGTASWNQGCGPYGQFCARKWSATTPGGQTYNGGATLRRTPYGGYVANRAVQGPNGNWFYGRRRW